MFGLRFIAAAVFAFGAVVGTGASASSLTFYEDSATLSGERFTLDCTGTCEAWVTDTLSFDGSIGDLFDNVNADDTGAAISGAADEEAAIENRAGELLAGIFKDPGNNEAGENHVFTSSAAYILIKIGFSPEWALVKNLSENNEFTFTATGQGAGLSHTSEAGDVCDFTTVICDPPVTEVPLPGTMPLLGAGILGAAFFARRKRKAA